MEAKARVQLLAELTYGKLLRGQQQREEDQYTVLKETTFGPR